PWSVRARAGCSNSLARVMRSPTRLAPSSSEYSEWQCRWTNDIDLEARKANGGRWLDPAAPHRVGARTGRPDAGPGLFASVVECGPVQPLLMRVGGPRPTGLAPLRPNH